MFIQQHTTYLLLGRMQHRHMDTNHTYTYTIRWLTEEKKTYTYRSKQTEKHYMYRQRY